MQCPLEGSGNFTMMLLPESGRNPGAHHDAPSHDPICKLSTHLKRLPRDKYPLFTFGTCRNYLGGYGSLKLHDVFRGKNHMARYTTFRPLGLHQVCELGIMTSLNRKQSRAKAKAGPIGLSRLASALPVAVQCMHMTDTSMPVDGGVVRRR